MQYSTVPTRSITAKAVTVGGMVLTQTDGRGNTTTTITDTAGRALVVTDANGHSTTTVYCDRTRILHIL